MEITNIKDPYFANNLCKQKQIRQFSDGEVVVHNQQRVVDVMEKKYLLSLIQLFVLCLYHRSENLNWFKSKN